MVTMLTYAESPMAHQVPPEWHDKIVHATLQLGDHELTGADVIGADVQLPQGFFVTVTVPDSADAQRIFFALANGGEVRLPFQSTFWSAGFGVVIDRFRVPWEINCAQPGPSA